MPDAIVTVIVGALGALLGAAVQHAFRRHAEAEQVRREIVETHLLQLQDAVESLYYRANNLLDLTGREAMTDEYHERTSVFILGRVLAHAGLLVARGVYARLPRDAGLKRDVKARLHAIDRGLDDRVFLHYHRLQLAEMLTDGARVLGYTEFLARWDDPRFATALAAARRFAATVPDDRLDVVRDHARALVQLLAAQTQVPSAISLAAEPLARDG